MPRSSDTWSNEAVTGSSYTVSQIMNHILNYSDSPGHPTRRGPGLTKETKYRYKEDAHDQCCSERKKRKTSKDIVEKYVDHIDYTSNTTIDALPDEMVVEIFRHLTIPDRLRTQLVCSRWSQLMTSEVLWKYVNLKTISPSLFIEILTSLPPCVLGLRSRFCYEALPMSLPEVMAKLHDQCPHLQSLFLENIHLVKNLHIPSGCATRNFKFYNAALIEGGRSLLDEPTLQILETKFKKEEDIDLLDLVLPKLQILSLREVLFRKSDVFFHFTSSDLPEIVVLDLSYSKPFLLDHIKDDLFCTLANLEELYLTKWSINDSHIMKFIQKAKKLRVLDLEHSKVTDKTIVNLKQNCACLEKLYVSHCNIGDISRSNVDNEFFPRLKSLCVRNTGVTAGGIERLLTECPSLKCIHVTACNDITKIWYDNLPEVFQKKLSLHPNGKKELHSHENDYLALNSFI